MREGEGRSTAVGNMELSAYERFRRSMAIDYEKWHDGIGYDLDALDQASPAERDAIEKLLLSRGARDWRDVEALARLDTEPARAVLRDALREGDAGIRMAVARHAPGLLDEAGRTRSLVQAIGSVEPFGGLSDVIDEAVEFHPPEVIDALYLGVLRRDGEVAVHFAALLLYLLGGAEEPFDMAERPFFLRFNTEDRAEREAAFRELCARVGADPEPYVMRARADGGGA